MSGKETTFAVAAMVRETPEVMDRFIRYYLRLGASEIFIFCDMPPLECDDPRVVIVDWRTHNTDALLKTRQVEAYDKAFAETSCDWILLADADEFIWSPASFLDILTDLPREIEVLRLPTAEAVWGPGDNLETAFGATHFRKAIGRGGKSSLLPSICLYGPRLGRIMPYGLAGHNEGKSVLRTGVDHGMLRLHAPWKNGRRVGVYANTLDIPEVYICHFDAISFARWKAKWSLRKTGVAKTLDTRARNLQGDNPSFKRFAGLYTLKRWQVNILRLFGLTFTARIFD